MNNTIATLTGIELERLHRVLTLDANDKDLVIAGLLGVIDHYSNFNDTKPAMEALTSELDKMLDTYEAEDDESEEE